MALVALPLMVPAKLTEPPVQTLCGLPAFAIARGFIVIVLVSLAGLQGPAGSFVVKVSMTVPEKLVAGV